VLLDGYNNGPGTAITQVQRVTSEQIGDANCNNMTDIPSAGGMQHYVQWNIPSAGYCLDATGTITSPNNGTTVHFRHRQQWTPPVACANTYFTGKTCIGQHEQWWDDNNRAYGLQLDRSAQIAKGLGMAFSIQQTSPSNWSAEGKYYNQSLDGPTIWSPATGAHQIYGEIAKKWKSMGAFNGPQGYPTSDEASTPNGTARYNNMQNGGIYWSSATGAQAIYGAIYQKWGQYGYEGGILKLPTTSETSTPDGVGRYNHFQGQNGSIYWSPSTGAHELQGMIKSRWAALGWENSYLGYPTSDEFAIAGGRQSNFQHGYITYNTSTGKVTDYRL
jgi:LGFP repeat